jgi:hypothetical protein
MKVSSSGVKAATRQSVLLVGCLAGDALFSKILLQRGQLLPHVLSRSNAKKKSDREANRAEVVNHSLTQAPPLFVR